MQQVRIGQHLSDEVIVRSRVPQGSVLGLFLYLLFIIDLTQDIRNVKVASFADDTKDWGKTCPKTVR